MTDSPPKKLGVSALKAALAAKKAAGPGNKTKLRADPGNARAQKDAERLAGKSRKVH